MKPKPWKRWERLSSCLLVTALLAACSGGVTPAPVATTGPTATPNPTATVTSTSDPAAARWSDFGEGWTYFDELIPEIVDAQVTPQGNLWVTTEESVFYWDLANNTSQRYTACGTVKETRGMTIDRQGDLWMITADSIVHWQLDILTCEEYTAGRGIPVDALVDDNMGCAGFYDIVQTPDGALWVSTCDHVVIQFQGIAWQIVPEIDGFRFQILNDGSLIVFGIFVDRYDGNEWTRLNDQAIINGEVYAFAKDLNDQFWMAASCCMAQRTYFLDNGVQEEVEELSIVSKIETGPDGNLWFGFWSWSENRASLRTFDGTRWNTVSLPAGTGGNEFVLAPDNTVWLFDQTLYHLRDGAWEQYDLPFALTVNATNPWSQILIPSHDGSVFVVNGFGGEIGHFDSEDWTLYFIDPSDELRDGERYPLQNVPSTQELNSLTLNHLVTDQISTFVFDQEGNLWIGYLGGVIQFDGRVWNYLPLRMNEWTLQLSFDSYGNLWAATQHGIVRLSDERLDIPIDMFQTVSIASGDHFFAIASDGQIWVATDTGVVVLSQDGTQAARYTDQDGLPSNNVSQLFITQNGQVWVSTEVGIAWFDGAQWQQSILICECDAVASLNGAMDGTLWVEFQNGDIQYYDGQEWQTAEVSTSAPLSAFLTTANEPMSLITIGNNICHREGGEGSCRRFDWGILRLVLGPAHSLWIIKYDYGAFELAGYMPSP